MKISSFPFPHRKKIYFLLFIQQVRSLCNIFKLTLCSHSCVFSSHYFVLASQFPLQLQFLVLGLISYSAWTFVQKNLSTEVENQYQIYTHKLPLTQNSHCLGLPKIPMQTVPYNCIPQMIGQFFSGIQLVYVLYAL